MSNASLGHPHLYPEPRLAVGRRLRNVVHAMIDVSDGLSTDLHHICEESHVAAILDEAALPIHPLAWEKSEALQLALNGGEDYELLFTAAADERIPGSIARVKIHRIGMIKRHLSGKPRVELESVNGHRLPLTAAGWQHFT